MVILSPRHVCLPVQIKQLAHKITTLTSQHDNVLKYALRSLHYLPETTLNLVFLNVHYISLLIITQESVYHIVPSFHHKLLQIIQPTDAF